MLAVTITVGPVRLTARFEESTAPRTCAAFQALLPLTGEILQARWSGEAAWVPLGDLRLDLPPENTTSHPRPGQILLYPRGVSETEILIPYGETRFASKSGQLAGNHFLTVVDGMPQLQALGALVYRQGAQAVTITLARDR